jgi:hypothetical protein
MPSRRRHLRDEATAREKLSSPAATPTLQRPLESMARELWPQCRSLDATEPTEILPFRLS